MKGDIPFKIPFRIPNRMGRVPIGFATGGRQREGGCPQPPLSVGRVPTLRRECPPKCGGTVVPVPRSPFPVP